MQTVDEFFKQCDALQQGTYIAKPKRITTPLAAAMNGMLQFFPHCEMQYHGGHYCKFYSESIFLGEYPKEYVVFNFTLEKQHDQTNTSEL